MALALLLMMVVIASLVVSVWLLARHREYTRRIYGLEERIQYLEKQMDPADENITMVVDGAGNARLQTQDETITHL